MITDAQDLAKRLSNWAIEASEIGYARRCNIELRIDPEGLLVAATSYDGKRRKAAVILWPEVLSFTGAVSRTINEFAEAVAEAPPIK
jgi:hypothetical protein